jgi:hypothetical protein
MQYLGYTTGFEFRAEIHGIHSNANIKLVQQFYQSSYMFQTLPTAFKLYVTNVSSSSGFQGSELLEKY